VPTPVDSNNVPDLTPVVRASETVAKGLTKGAVVVYESTVYPGVTEEVCGPILEKGSGLKCGTDFALGYSPERINPGDKEHTLERITKVVSGEDAATLDRVANAYGKIIDAGVHRAPSIKVAEAAKVIENTQRDLNIALVNELALIFDRMGIRTSDVLAAAGTKWNFLKFKPGLVGGHCIGVDPYYLTQKAQAVGYHPEMILAGRRINDGMGSYIAQQTARLMTQKQISLVGARALVMGLTFKENCPDIRNTKVVDVIAGLREFGLQVDVYDPWVAPEQARHEYGIELIRELAPGTYDTVVLAVAHRQFGELGAGGVRALGKVKSVVYDVKSLFDRAQTDGRL